MNKISAAALSLLVTTSCTCGGNKLASQGRPQTRYYTNTSVIAKDSCQNYAKPIAKIYPEKINQGETAILTVNSKQHLSHPTFTYDGKNLPLYQKNDSTYTGLIGTSPQIKPHKTQILLKDETQKLLDTLNFEVKRGIYGIQNVPFTKDVAALKEKQCEKDEIRALLRTESPKSYLSASPYESPIKGIMSSEYGTHRYSNGHDTGDFHKGIDIAAPKGEAIKPIQPGVVLAAKQYTLEGNAVFVDHGQGVISVYMHMSEINVKPGQIIDTNTIIGKVGTTGHSNAPHLHWGLYIHGIPVNPESGWSKPIPKSQKVLARLNKACEQASVRVKHHVKKSINTIKKVK